MLANAPTAGGGTPPVTSIDQLVVRIQTKIDAHTPAKDVINLKNNLVKLLHVELDGVKGARSGTDILGEFPLNLGKKPNYDLKISIPHGSSGETLVVTDDLKFTSSGGKWTIDTSTLDPRLTSLSAAGKTPGDTIWTLSLDPSFLKVTTRTRVLNPHFGALSPAPKKLDDPGITKARVQVLEDPRPPQVAPLTYTVLSPSDTAGAGEFVNVFLYFQNEDPASPDAEHHTFREVSNLLGPPSASYGRGQYGSTADYTPYPYWSWALQMERAAADVLLVIPNVLPTGNTMEFGDLGDPATGVKRLEKLIWARWADSDPEERTKNPPKLGRLIIGGLSSGMRTVFDWFHKDSANRIDAIFCFDAIGASASHPTLGKYAFPGGWDWRVWLDKKEHRKVAFLNGQYSQPAAIPAADYLTKNGYGKRILLHEPADAAYWYDHADFKAAHHGMSFPPLPATGVTANTVYVKKELNKKAWRSYQLVLCHGSNPAKTEKLLPNVSIHEAADIMRHEFGMPASPTLAEFVTAVSYLNDTGSSDESDRARTGTPYTVLLRGQEHQWQLRGLSRAHPQSSSGG